MSGKINRTHDVQWRTPQQLKTDGIAPSSNSSKSGTSYQCFTGICWKGRALHCHFSRQRKVQTWNATPHYKLVGESVTGDSIVRAVVETLGPAFKKAGVKVVFADNDGKLHQQQVKEAWARFGITLWPAAGKTSWDRAVEGFPVDFPSFMPLDASIHHLWKNSKEGLYARWNARKPGRKNVGAFVNDIKNSWEDMSQKAIQNSIDGQRNALRMCYNSKGKI